MYADSAGGYPRYGVSHRDIAMLKAHYTFSFVPFSKMGRHQ